MATVRDRRDKTSLFVRAKSRLGATAEELAGIVGSSQRTMERAVAGAATIYEGWFARLAVAVHGTDAALAAELADAAGTTLDSLGLGRPADPGAVALAVMPASMRAMLVDSVVAAAAEALDASPRVARPALLAALERAKGAGLALDDLLAALRPAAPAPAEAPTKGKVRT